VISIAPRFCPPVRYCNKPNKRNLLNVNKERIEEIFNPSDS
jgi:hypothetical protein